MVGHVHSVQYLEGDCCLWSWDFIPQIKSLAPWNLSWGCDWTIVHQTCTSPREIVSYRVGYLEGWQPCFKCMESIHWLHLTLLKEEMKMEHSKFAFAHLWNATLRTEVILLLHFYFCTFRWPQALWNEIVIIASRGSDVLSFCLFFFFTSWHFNKSNHTWTNWLVPLVLQTSNSQFLVHHKIWAEDLYSAFSSHVRKHKDSLISSSSSCVL